MHDANDQAKDAAAALMAQAFGTLAPEKVTSYPGEPGFVAPGEDHEREGGGDDFAAGGDASDIDTDATAADAPADPDAASALPATDLPDDELVRTLEAMLFVCDEAQPASAFAEILDLETARVEEGFQLLASQLEEQNRGIVLKRLGGRWRLFSAPTAERAVERLVRSWDRKRLSPAALETLAVVAYTGPATRGEIARVRGVNSDSSLSSLIDKGLVREAGTDDAPGNPTLYAVSRTFLERFGLDSARDLPDPDDFVPDEATRTLIARRLGMPCAPDVSLAASNPAPDAASLLGTRPDTLPLFDPVVVPGVTDLEVED